MDTILIVDDEPLARSRLQRLLSAFPEHQLIGEASDGDTALRLATELQPDLVFLDIDMPDGTGFDLLQQLTPVTFKVIFITGHED